jgi:hypothetical protein
MLHAVQHSVSILAHDLSLSARVRFRVLGPLFCAVTGVLLLSGCSAFDDPDFNPYAPPPSGRTLLETADDLVEIPERALDNFDRRFENIVY